MYAHVQADDLEAAVGPFLLSTEFAKDDQEVTDLCTKLHTALFQAFGNDDGMCLYKDVT